MAAVPMPDGRILIATGSDDKTVRLWNLDGHEVGRIVAGATIWNLAFSHDLPDGEANLLIVAGTAGFAVIDIAPPK